MSTRTQQTKRKKSAVRKSSTTISSQIKWIWLLSGTLAGILISASLFLKFGQPSTAPQPSTKAVKSSSQPPKKPIPQQPKLQVEKPKYEFYTMLPNNKTNSFSDAKPKQTLNSSHSPINKYIVQVASFQKKEEANELKARLTLSAFDTDIEAVKVGQATWYRVIIGPFADEQTAIQNQQKLDAEKITGSLVLVKHQ